MAYLKLPTDLKNSTVFNFYNSFETVLAHHWPVQGSKELSEDYKLSFIPSQEIFSG